MGDADTPIDVVLTPGQPVRVWMGSRLLLRLPSFRADPPDQPEPPDGRERRGLPTWAALLVGFAACAALVAGGLAVPAVRDAIGLVGPVGPR